MPATLNLVHENEPIDFPATHYVFVESIGHIPANAPGAWKIVQRLAPALMQHNKITGAAAFFKPLKDVYRAGFMLSAPPVQLPDGLTYQEFPGGKYIGFTLTGPFDQLPEAHTRACAVIGEEKIALRDDFYIEHYLTDPSTTPAEQNVTTILFPLA